MFNKRNICSVIIEAGGQVSQVVGRVEDNNPDYVIVQPCSIEEFDSLNDDTKQSAVGGLTFHPTILYRPCVKSIMILTDFNESLKKHVEKQLNLES